MLAAIRALGYPCMSLHAHGKGLEDILVGIRCSDQGCKTAGHKRWVLVEVKVARNKRAEATECQFTPAQLEWYKLTEGFPRVVATSAQDCVDQLRRMVG